MSGISNLDELLHAMKPKLLEGDYVFCTIQGHLTDYANLNPLATFVEAEGLTLVLLKSTAEQAGLAFNGVFKQITLTVHSSLTAVGLTAAVSKQLADHGISANVMAAYYHDHIFVPLELAEQAVLALQSLSD